VSVTIDGGYRSGWVRAILYDQDMNELARSTGTVVPPAIAPSGAASFPVVLTAQAPTTPGTYTWHVSWYGNQYDASSGFFGAGWTPDPSNPGHGEEIVSIDPFTVESVAPPYPPSKMGIFQNGNWYLDADGSMAWESGTDTVLSFGKAGDTPVSGDWNGDGLTDAGVVRGNMWYLDLNGNGIWETGTDIMFTFGIVGDIPVSGDWNGDGVTEVGVVRGNRWYLDLDGNDAWESGADVVLVFGIAGDIPVTGDWNGDGFTEVGVVRGNKWYVDLNGNGTWDSGTGDAVFSFGTPGDIPVTGDWNGDGFTEAGIVRGNSWYLDADGSGSWDGTSVDMFGHFGGNTTWTPVTGNW